MSEEHFNHNVFKNDPVYLKSLIDQYAIIETKYNDSFSGFIDAIDPVTESIILTSKEETGMKSIVVMGHAITSISTEQPPNGYKPRIKLPAQEIDVEYANARKAAILNWFKLNLLPVEDNDGILQVHGGHLCIMPPYSPDDCISNNSIILGRIQKLLHNMPDENDSRSKDS